MREIVLDTETTGMDPAEGHRLIEIGCVELMNHLPTGAHCHIYINPERDVPMEAVAVHGLTTEMLVDKPIFSQCFVEFLDFIQDSRLVIHNAAFDMKFLNAELKRVGHPGLPMKRVTDTLTMAREKFPGAPANLDALCRRFGIDNSSRELHGALLDSELLAEVYLELLGGRQHSLHLDDQAAAATSSRPSGHQRTAHHATGTGAGPVRKDRPVRAPRPHAPTPEEQTAHAALLEEIREPVWKTLASEGTQ